MPKPSRWNPDRPPELVPIPIDDDLYQQLIADLAKRLYDGYCQLAQRGSRGKSIETQKVLLPEQSPLNRDGKGFNG